MELAACYSIRDMPVSIKDIARLAGVSHSTVSRALRKSSLIRFETAERIRQIAESQGYSPSAVARGLVTSKTEAIGVVVTSIADPFNGEVVAGIEELANEQGYTVILANSNAEPDREVAVVRSFQARRVDGILVASSRVGALHTPLLSELQIPIVLLNNQHPSAFVHSVRFDNEAGAYQAVRHLVGLGHNNIAYLGDRFGLHSDAERYAGYSRMMAEAGLNIDESLVIRGDGKPAGARAAAQQLFSSTAMPTAVFCYNDMTALGVLSEAAAMGIAVPEDLSVIGFDDIFFGSYLNPPLTTVRQPMKELGRRAMQLLLALLRKEETERTILVEGELVVRGSTAGPRPRHYQSILSGKNSETNSS
jgi:LacI family transcriptional regulator, repressor for deo operon, udp, cdd, tsx, nupC, and nupG